MKDFPNGDAVCFSRDPYARQLDTILVLPWQEGIKRYFMKEDVIEIKSNYTLLKEAHYQMPNTITVNFSDHSQE
ncbi:MAG: hypothetical protein V4496_03965 [Pseudomonadota bacterium]